jgi:hypothetical protein
VARKKAAAAPSEGAEETMRTAAFVLASFAIAATAWAQQSDHPAPAAAAAAPKAPFVVPAGETRLEVLLNSSAAYLGCNILWEARELGGADVEPVRLQKALSTDRDGCLEFLAASLHRTGFALTWASEKTNTLEAINLRGARAREVSGRAQTRTADEVLANASLAMPVTTTVPLKHINPTIATNALRPFFASTGGATGCSLTLGSTGGNCMVVSGMGTQVAAAIRLLRETDQPRAEPPPPSEAQRRIDELEKRVQALEAKLAALGAGK